MMSAANCVRVAHIYLSQSNFCYRYCIWTTLQIIALPCKYLQQNPIIFKKHWNLGCLLTYLVIKKLLRELPADFLRLIFEELLGSGGL
jgi:hypothetical protein